MVTGQSANTCTSERNSTGGSLSVKQYIHNSAVLGSKFGTQTGGSALAASRVDVHILISWLVVL